MVLLPPRGRISVIHVEDLGRLLLALIDPGCPDRLMVEPDDGRHTGWSHEEFGQALGRAVGRRVVTLTMPRSLVRLGARIDGLFRGDSAKLTADRASYFCHPDWTVEPARGAPETLWRPAIGTEQGLTETARWYRAEGWL